MVTGQKKRFRLATSEVSMGISSKGKYKVVQITQLTPKDKNGKQKKKTILKGIRVR